MTTRGIRRTIAALTVVGTLPYLTLKAAWLSGSRIGLVDPDFGHGGVMLVLNLATFAMDATAIALALAFVLPFGRRLPAWSVLTPMWVGTGLLAPILLVVPLQVVLGVPDQPTGRTAPLADWVYLVVYGGFAWQGLFLLTGFALHAHERWGRRAADPLPRVAIGGGAGASLVLLALAAVAVVAQSASRSWSTANVTGDVVLLALAGVGLVLLHGGRGPRWRAVVATWIGTGGSVAWGLYHLVLLTVPNDLDDRGSALDVLTQVLRVVAGASVLVVALRRARSERFEFTDPQRDGSTVSA